MDKAKLREAEIANIRQTIRRSALYTRAYAYTSNHLEGKKETGDWALAELLWDAGVRTDKGFEVIKRTRPSEHGKYDVVVSTVELINYKEEGEGE